MATHSVALSRSGGADLMRVLHLYSGDLFGGIQTYLITLARFHSLCPSMEPEFALCYSGILSQELQAQGATIHWLGKVRMRYPWTVLRARGALRKLLHKGNYDVAVCHSIWNQFIFGPIVRRVGLPLVFYQHNTFSGRYWFERWAGRVLPDYAICNSRYTQTSLANIYPGVESQVIYFPVSPPKQFSAQDRTATRSELQTPAEAVVIIQVSRMDSWKGHVLHLDALAKLAQVPGWVAWIVGGPQRSPEHQFFAGLQEQAARLGISDRVRFLGQRTDVARLLAAADIFCQPNVGSPEPFGIVFVEALGAGLPVVSTRMGAALEIVDDSCGILVPPENVEGLAHALEQLLVETDVRRDLSCGAPKRAQSLCAPEKQMKILEQVLSAAISRHRGVYQAA
jgi:glycosyltransferase involved in cell wall biosynthesis